MIGRRPLGALLGELAESTAALAGGDSVRVRSMSISLPIDLRLVIAATGPEVVGDVPLFRTRTDFDPEPARLEVEWRAMPAERVRP